MKAAFIHSDEINKYSYGAEHPFVAARSGKTLEMCREKGLMDSSVEHIISLPASRKEVSRFHEDDYLEILKTAEAGEVSLRWLEYGLGKAECPVFPGLWDYSLLVAGGSLAAARLVADEKFERTFHPAGGLHHAHPRLAGGFCYINDVVLAVMELRSRGLRVAVVDIDAHHGDGTQGAFYNDPNVLTVSIHESGKTLFPWGGWANERGEGPGEGYNLNIPLPVDTYDEIFLKALSEIVIPAVVQYKPDILVTEVGADILTIDPMAHLSMTNNAIADSLEMMDKLRLPWVVVGGGGYAVDATVKAWTLAWSVVARQFMDDPYAGVIGGMMTGLADVQEGDLRDRNRYIIPETRKSVEKELLPVLDYWREQLEKEAFAPSVDPKQ